MLADPSTLLNVVDKHVGDALRAVSSYEGREYDLHLLRDDIRERYSDEEIRNVFDDLALSGMSREYYEKLFHAGQLDCSIYGFEAAAMFHFTVNETEGVFVSFDRDTEINLDAFINDCNAVIESHG